MSDRKVTSGFIKSPSLSEAVSNWRTQLPSELNFGLYGGLVRLAIV